MSRHSGFLMCCLVNACFKVQMLCMQVSCYFLTIYLSGKEGPSFRVWGASLFHQRSTSYAFLLGPFFTYISALAHAILHCTFLTYDIHMTQVVKLYERCLIACANYPEYWIRYVLCMEASGSMDLANNALARATQVFVKVWISVLAVLFYFGLVL